jgi:hypothetical protein
MLRWRGSERDGRAMATLPDDPERALPALLSETFDVGGERFADPQPVEDEQARQRQVPGLEPRMLLDCRFGLSNSELAVVRGRGILLP